jgi:hypothetical protein
VTERLSALLRDEAAALDIPPVDHAAILGRGQQARTRRRSTGFLAAAAVVVIIGSGTAIALDGDGDRRPDDRATDPVAAPASSRGFFAYGAGPTVVVTRPDPRTSEPSLPGSATTVVDVPGTLHSLHYTSAGVLARSNTADGASDGSGPETLTVVAEDGTTTDLGTIPEGVGPATDPDEPVYALAERSGDGFEAVVRDVLTGEEVASIPLPDLPMSYWAAPPLALDGDVVYAGFESGAVAFDWRTGEEVPAEGVPGGMPEVRGGQALALGEELGEGGALELVVSVVDAASGATTLVVPLEEGEYGAGSLSPDGRYLRFTAEAGTSPSGEGAEGPKVYDLDTGRAVQLPGGNADWGWTSGGFPFRVTSRDLEVCDPATGTCRPTTWTSSLGEGLRLGGTTYES